MLTAAFFRINLPSGHLIANPLKLDEVKINEISEDDMMKYFNEDDGIEKETNNYYFKAVLKLAMSITATFESNHNYVIYHSIKVTIINVFRFILILVAIFIFG